jgi:hypothetical protein
MRPDADGRLDAALRQAAATTADPLVRDWLVTIAGGERADGGPPPNQDIAHAHKPRRRGRPTRGSVP